MTEVSSLHNNASAGRITPPAESLSDLHLEQEWKKCDNRNSDDLQTLTLRQNGGVQFWTSHSGALCKLLMNRAPHSTPKTGSSFLSVLGPRPRSRKNLTRDFQMCLFIMKNSTSFEDFMRAHTNVGRIRAGNLYNAYSSDVESYLNDANDYLLEIEGSMNEMSGNLSPDAQNDWELSQNEEANMEDFEKCIKLMNIKVVQSFNLKMSDFMSVDWREIGLVTRALGGHDMDTEGYIMLNMDCLGDIYCVALQAYVKTFWRIPIYYNDLTSEGLKWHMNLRGLEAQSDEGDQGVVDRLKAFDRDSRSARCLHCLMVPSCEHVKSDKLRLMAEVIEDNDENKKDLFERVARATGRKTWDGIDLDYRP
ncbi:hypothetical protein TRICI_004822 [Trichomonascus ciferrii]|uniref:Uncharacterized protein n=1 Tax=Trichomonascus ciferrii TaxID=44093 RepID=A0A642V0K0_9ASCO|nr:hypothetical protein TRICI_004822 [Trichomonascus ciferrii]